MIGVIDCNNFFVSCERVSQVHLRNKPVVVLSNNDGCVVARSNEAKALGIPMGEPFFKIKHLVQQAGLLVCSCNHTLYASISQHVMDIIDYNTVRMEQYSIDEAFVDFTGIPQLDEVARHIVEQIWQDTTIPVSIGIAPNKTLAKIASRFAKKYPGYHSVCAIDTEEKREKALRLTDIADVWGVGRRTHAKLLAADVRTAYDFTQMPLEHVQRVYHKHGEQMWRELRGEVIHDLESPSARQSMQHTRTFRRPIMDFATLHGIIVDFAVKLSMKLRREHSAALMVSVFFASNRFSTSFPYQVKEAQHRFDVATSDERELAVAARQCLESMYVEGFPVKRAGVGVSLIEHEAVQRGLFDAIDRDKQRRLQSAIDKIHACSGANALRLASQTDVAIVDGETATATLSQKPAQLNTSSTRSHEKAMPHTRPATSDADEHQPQQEDSATRTQANTPSPHSSQSSSSGVSTSWTRRVRFQQ